MIVAFTGRRRSGKDFAGRLAIEQFGGRRFAFADDLKAQCRRIFGLTQLQVGDGKEQNLALPVDMDQYIDKMSSETGLFIQPARCVAGTPRQLLQFYGTEYVRRICDSYWIDRVIATQIPDAVERDNKWWAPWRWRSGRNQFITDCRFQNECDAVHAAGGIVVRVVRSDLDRSARQDSHASESAIDDLPADLEIYNTLQEGTFRRVVKMALGHDLG